MYVTYTLTISVTVHIISICDMYTYVTYCYSAVEKANKKLVRNANLAYLFVPSFFDSQTKWPAMPHPVLCPLRHSLSLPSSPMFPLRSGHFGAAYGIPTSWDG